MEKEFGKRQGLAKYGLGKGQITFSIWNTNNYHHHLRYNNRDKEAVGLEAEL